eukprot:TRINITY_DN74036_c0_g1_i1.p1 TRINITY_DN74036_c0_g1~~TRINITY_DN74036_c0_g1_i1.p1  ORF type:complete len:231 (+),score=60.37 TRINITY_DN74036_c0_g1_i1:84-776(+)
MAATQPSLGSAQVPQSGEEHPFDSPFALMQSMQAEIRELRDALNAEAQRRTSEVEALRAETNSLRAALEQERSERQASCNFLEERLNSETGDIRGNAAKFEYQTNAALSERAELSSHTALRSEFDDLCARHQREVAERTRALQELTANIEANAHGDNEFAQQMRSELNHHSKLLTANEEKDIHFEEVVLSRLSAAGALLQKGAGMYNAARQASPGGGAPPGAADMKAQLA